MRIKITLEGEINHPLDSAKRHWYFSFARYWAQQFEKYATGINHVVTFEQEENGMMAGKENMETRG